MIKREVSRDFEALATKVAAVLTEENVNMEDAAVLLHSMYMCIIAAYLQDDIIRDQGYILFETIEKSSREQYKLMKEDTQNESH